MIKAEFSASFLQSSVSRDLQKSFGYSDLLLMKQFLLSFMLKTVVLLIFPVIQRKAFI